MKESIYFIMQDKEKIKHLKMNGDGGSSCPVAYVPMLMMTKDGGLSFLEANGFVYMPRDALEVNAGCTARYTVCVARLSRPSMYGKESKEESK